MPTLERAGMGGIVTLSGFSGVGYRIGDGIFPTGILLWPEMARQWSPPPFDSLTPDDFAALNEAEPPLDLLLIGTGARLRRPVRALTEALGALGIGMEPMDSRAAARTYNLLAGEGRRVAAALYPLDV